MNYFEKFLCFLQRLQMETPNAFGWFHIMWIVFIVIAIVFRTFIGNCFILAKIYIKEKSIKPMFLLSFLYI